MNVSVSMNDGLIHLSYAEDEGEEILLKYLIKMYNLEDIDYRMSLDIEGGYLVQRTLKIDTRIIRVDKVVDCIREIEKYKDYKYVEKKGFFKDSYEYIGLTREEKLTEIKSIIDKIKDKEFLKKLDDLLDRQVGLIIDDIFKCKNKELYIREYEFIKNIKNLLKDFYENE